jgi:hypothetical protein
VNREATRLYEEEQKVLFPAEVREVCLLEDVVETGHGAPLPIYPNNGETSARR